MLGYLSDLTDVPIDRKITFLRRWVLVNSIMYYELDHTMHGDRVYDERVKLLVALQNEHKEILEELELHYIYKDFDGSTGFDLYHSLNEEDKDYFYNYALHCKFVTRNRG